MASSTRYDVFEVYPRRSTGQSFTAGVTFRCAVIAHFGHLLIRWWIPGWFLPSGRAAGHTHVQVSVWTQFPFLSAGCRGAGLRGQRELFAEPSSTCRTVFCSAVPRCPSSAGSLSTSTPALAAVWHGVLRDLATRAAPVGVTWGLTVGAVALTPPCGQFLLHSQVAFLVTFPLLLDGSGAGPFRFLGFRQGRHPGALLKYCLLQVPP